MLGVPLLREGILIGYARSHAPVVRPFTEKQIELLTTFADQAVIAIENVRLFDEVQKRTQELSESLEQQTATSEVLRVISSSPGELDPVFETMLSNAPAFVRQNSAFCFFHEGCVPSCGVAGVPPALSNSSSGAARFRQLKSA